jgi:hypothetical protein
VSYTEPIKQTNRQDYNNEQATQNRTAQGSNKKHSVTYSSNDSVWPMGCRRSTNDTRSAVMIKSIDYKYGTAGVLYYHERTRPYQITVAPLNDLDLPPRMVSFKTLESVINRLNANWEHQQALFIDTQKSWAGRD